MSVAGLTIGNCLTEMSARLTDASAVARAALVCSESGSEREALRIAMDLDEILNEARVLHEAMRLVGRMSAKLHGLDPPG